MGHMVVEELTGIEKSGRERGFWKKHEFRFYQAVLDLVADIPEEIQSCESEQKGSEICESSTQRW